MARGQKRAERALPPPLPPAERTVGQLVGEAIRLYGANFWKALALGVPVVIVNALAWSNSSGQARLGLVLAAALLISLSYVGAVALVTSAPLRSRSALLAYVLGVLVFLPFPVLVTIFVLPGLAWLALLGLSVPAALVEQLGARAALVRGYRLARADFIHVLGGLATLALVVVISQFSLSFVLREFAENTRLAAAALASLVVSPLVFLGSAILYVDQKARLDSRGDRPKE
jgi:predicted permease